MNKTSQAKNATNTAKPRQPENASLFAFGFQPLPSSTSSPSRHSAIGSTPAASSPKRFGARNQSLNLEGPKPNNSSQRSPKKGRKPGRVAQPGAGLAAVKRMSTAPAAFPARVQPSPSDLEQYRENLQPEPSSPQPGSSTHSCTDCRDSQQTPEGTQDLRESSPTPRGLSTISSPSGRLSSRITPLANRTCVRTSSSIFAEEVVEDSEPESTQPSSSKAEPRSFRSLKSASIQLVPVPSSSDEDEIIVSSRSACSSRSNSCAPARRRQESEPTFAAQTEVQATSDLPIKSPRTSRTSRSISRAPILSSRPSPAPPSRSSARLRSQSVEAPTTVPHVINPTSSIANLSTSEESSTSSHLKPVQSSRRSRSNTPTNRSQRTVTPGPQLTTQSTSQQLTYCSPASQNLSASLATPDHARSSPFRTRFQREPSGSTLSDLAPTPTKPEPPEKPFRIMTGPTKHTFELVIDSRREQSRIVRAGSVRRARSTATSDFTDRPSSELNLRRIEDGCEDGQETASSNQETTDEDEEPIGTWRRFSPARGKRRTTNSSLPRARPTVTKAKRRILSSSASEDNEEEEEKEKEEEAVAESEDAAEDGDDDEDDVLAALARARARKAAGQTIGGTSPSLAETSTAPTTASSIHTSYGRDHDYARRSSGAKHPTDRYSPTDAIPGPKRGGAIAKPSHATFAEKRPVDGDRRFDKMMRELQAQRQKGRGSDWYEAQKEMLGRSDDDSDEASDDTDQDLPDLSLGQTRHINTLAQGIAGAVSEDDLLSPDKAAHRKRAREVASILGDEEKKKMKAGLADETRQERQMRTIWKEQHRYEVFDVGVLQGEGWIGRLASAIKDGLLAPQSFPSSISLCSRLSSEHAKTSADLRTAARWLLALVCDPSTPAELVEKVFHLLHRIVKLHSPSSARSPLFEEGDLPQQLVRFGADPSKLLRPAAVADEEKPDSDEENDLMELDLLGGRATTPIRRTMQQMSVEDRLVAVRRWCRVVQIATLPNAATLAPPSLCELIEVCVRMSLEPNSSTLRGSLEQTLLFLLRSAQEQDPEIRFGIFRRLASLYRSSRPRTHVEVLNCLPHRSSADKQIRKWLAWAFLAADDAYLRVSAHAPSFPQSLLPHLLELVTNPPPSTAFIPPATSTDSSNDIKLFQQATLLLIAFTDLDDELNYGAGKHEAQEYVDKIRAAVKKIDGKLRADARKGLLVERIQAKNLLTSITNSLEYQLRRARGQQAGLSVMDIDTEDESVDEHQTKRKLKVDS